MNHTIYFTCNFEMSGKWYKSLQFTDNGILKMFYVNPGSTFIHCEDVKISYLQVYRVKGFMVNLDIFTFQTLQGLERYLRVVRLASYATFHTGNIEDIKKEFPAAIIQPEIPFYYEHKTNEHGNH